MHKAFNSPSSSKLSTDPVVKLKAVLLAKKPGGRARDGTVGAGLVANILGLRDKTVRGWILCEEEIRQQVVDAGHCIKDIAADLPDIDLQSKIVPSNYVQSPDVSGFKGYPNHSMIKPQFEIPLKGWIKTRVSETKIGRIHFMLAVKKVQEWDPGFMPEPNSNDEKAVASYKRRARGWFLRFCRRHNIVLTRTGRSLGGGDRHSHQHDSAFKLRAVLSAREIVENGRGPNGTRGKIQAAREFGVSANAIWKWTQKEALLRKDLEKTHPDLLVVRKVAAWFHTTTTNYTPTQQSEYIESSHVQPTLYADASGMVVAPMSTSCTGSSASPSFPEVDVSTFAVDKLISSDLPSN